MKDHKNRMNEAQTRGPGRPTQQELKENPPQPAKTVVRTSESLVCPCCGRGARTRIIHSLGDKRTHICNSCAGRFVATYNPDDKPVSVRVLQRNT
jgi:uncharacterized protein (DUF983 family)